MTPLIHNWLTSSELLLQVPLCHRRGATFCLTTSYLIKGIHYKRKTQRENWKLKDTINIWKLGRESCDFTHSKTSYLRRGILKIATQEVIVGRKQSSKKFKTPTQSTKDIQRERERTVVLIQICQCIVQRMVHIKSAEAHQCLVVLNGLKQFNWPTT